MSHSTSRDRNRNRDHLRLLKTDTPWALPVVNPMETILAPTEWRLSTAAIAAQEGDTAARDSLFAALWPKMERQTWPFRRGRWGSLAGSAWDRDDIAQEAYLVFVELLASWPQQTPFPTYLLGHFGWRLRAAMGRLRGAEPRVVRLDGRLLLIDESAEAERARALIGALASDLDPIDGRILLLHVVSGESVSAIAHRLRVNRRYVRRRWLAIAAALRQTLTEGHGDKATRGFDGLEKPRHQRGSPNRRQEIV